MGRISAWKQYTWKKQVPLGKQMFSAKRMLSVFMSVALCSCTLAGCTGKKESGQIEKVTLNYAGSYSNLKMAVIMHEHLIEKYLPEGTEVEWTKLAAAADIRDGILSGEIDIGAYALPTFIIGEQKDTPLMMISAEGATPIKVYSNQEDIQYISDFRPDDKIALVGLGSILHIAFLAQIFEGGGISIAEYDQSFTVMPHADGLAALSGGKEVTGLILTFPTTLKADQTETIHEVSDLSERVLEYGIGTVNVTSDALYQEHPEVIEAFVKAQQEAIRLYEEEPERFAEILADDWNIDIETVKDTLKIMPPSMEVTGYDKQAQLLYQMGMLEGEPKAFKQLENYEQLQQFQEQPNE